MTEFEPIRTRRLPLSWHIYSRRGWYRALPVWEMEEAERDMADWMRRRRAGITRRAIDLYPWVPGDRAARSEGWGVLDGDAAA
jgi:hypothetical protein